MQVAYTLTLDDLVRLSRYRIQRSVGMSLWLLYLCGFTLGPVGLLGVWFYASEMMSRHRILWADVFGSLMFLFFLWTGFTAVRHLPGSLKRGARDRVRQHPALLQERCLIAVENGLLESAPGTVAQIHEKEKTDTPTTEEETKQFRQNGALLTAPWAEVNAIEEDSHGLYILVTSQPGFVIPKRIFQEPAALQQLHEYLIACWAATKDGTPFPSPGEVWPPPPRLS